MAKSKSAPKTKKDATENIKPKINIEVAGEESKVAPDPVESGANENFDEAHIDEQVIDETLFEEKLSAERDKYLRLAAEYDNYRKRSTKEREMIYSDARTDAISKLLPVYDNLERALKMECSDESYYKGVEMIMAQLKETLSSMNVKEIPAIGEPFDPNRHNAVMSIEDPNLSENIIAEEFQKGFILGDRVIRFSTVVVAK